VVEAASRLVAEAVAAVAVAAMMEAEVAVRRS
jgi:hypothetical protein